MVDPSRAHTFVFADLAGFTALTEAMGDLDAADLAHDFYDAVQALADGRQVEVVKSIGDAVMLRADEAAQAIDLALCVVQDVGGRHFFPTFRLGMHTGPWWHGTATGSGPRSTSLHVYPPRPQVARSC